MGLSFLSEEVKSALAHLNYNFVSEIRLRLATGTLFAALKVNLRLKVKFHITDSVSRAFYF